VEGVEAVEAVEGKNEIGGNENDDDNKKGEGVAFLASSASSFHTLSFLIS